MADADYRRTRVDAFAFSRGSVQPAALPATSTPELEQQNEHYLSSTGVCADGHVSLVLLSYSSYAQLGGLGGSDAIDSSDLELKIFSLMHADAEQLTTTIKPLFNLSRNMPMAIVFDKRTNTIIARGPKSEVEVLEAVLLRLDQQVPDRKSDDPSTFPAPRYESPSKQSVE